MSVRAVANDGGRPSEWTQGSATLPRIAAPLLAAAPDHANGEAPTRWTAKASWTALPLVNSGVCPL